MDKFKALSDFYIRDHRLAKFVESSNSPRTSFSRLKNLQEIPSSPLDMIKEPRLYFDPRENFSCPRISNLSNYLSNVTVLIARMDMYLVNS